jgi:hypothetical protein
MSQQRHNWRWNVIPDYSKPMILNGIFRRWAGNFNAL